jgi:hypothetical protein
VNCVSSVCTLYGKVAIGGACLKNTQCPTGITCSPDGICGGTGAYCQTSTGANNPALCANGGGLQATQAGKIGYR